MQGADVPDSIGKSASLTFQVTAEAVFSANLMA